MESSFDRLNWIKSLVQAEEQMEQSGFVSMTTTSTLENSIKQDTIQFLNQMKEKLIEASVAFNEMKTSPVGRLKIYGVAQTVADFMLFRNGYKMIFSMKQPGMISIRFNFLGPQQTLPAVPTMQRSVANLMEEHLIVAKKGPFQDLEWTFQDQPVKLENVVKYHLTLFVQESAK